MPHLPGHKKPFTSFLTQGMNNTNQNINNLNTPQNPNINKPTSQSFVNPGGGNQIMAATPSWGELWDQGTGGGEQVPDDIWQGGASGWDAQDWVNFFQNSDNYNWNQSFWGVLNGMVGSSSPTEILNWASHNFYNQNSGDNPVDDPIDDPVAGGSLQDSLMDMYNQGNYDFNQDGLVDIFDIHYAQQNTDWDFSGGVEWVDSLVNSITGGPATPIDGHIDDPVVSPPDSKGGQLAKRLYYPGTSGGFASVGTGIGNQEDILKKLLGNQG